MRNPEKLEYHQKNPDIASITTIVAAQQDAKRKGGKPVRKDELDIAQEDEVFMVKS